MARENVVEYFDQVMKEILFKKGFSVTSVNNNLLAFFFFFQECKHTDAGGLVVKIQKSVDLTNGKQTQQAKFDAQKVFIDEWSAKPSLWIMKANEIFSRNSESTNKYINQRQQQTNALHSAKDKVKFRVKQHNHNIQANTYGNSQGVDDYNDDEIDLQSSNSMTSFNSTNEDTQIDDDILSMDIYSNSQSSATPRLSSEPIPKKSPHNILQHKVRSSSIGSSSINSTSNSSSINSSLFPQHSSNQQSDFNSYTPTPNQQKNTLNQLPDFNVILTEANLQNLLRTVGLLASTEEQPQYLEQLRDHWEQKLNVIKKEQILLTRMQKKLATVYSIYMNSESDQDGDVNDLMEINSNQYNLETPHSKKRKVETHKQTPMNLPPLASLFNSSPNNLDFE